MISSFRNMSNSKVGMAIIIVIGALIVFSFAMADIQNVGTSFSGSSNALATAGGEEVTDRDMSEAMEQQLAQARQQNPEAGYGDLAFDPLLESLITERALAAFADDHDFMLSKRLVDAEIARLPGVTGPDGKFSDGAYRQFLSQQRLTDSRLRQAFGVSLLERLLVLPVAAEARVPSGIARPYASMLLEQRKADVVLVPTRLFAQGINPSDKDVENFYRAQSARYMVPERRVLRIARITPDMVDTAAPTDAEIAQSLKARSGEFAVKDIRTISQVVVPEASVARQVAAAAKTGSFADAAQPAGFSAADISVGPQTREDFASLAGDKVAAAVFADSISAGDVIGPIQSDFGWHVVKVDDISKEGGVSADEARRTVVADLTAAKAENALVDKVTEVEDLIADGASFAEAVQQAGLKASRTPQITAAGRARGDDSFVFPEGLAPALKLGFQLFSDDDPETVSLGEGQGYALVDVDDIVEAAPAPLADIRDRVRADFIRQQALGKARGVAAAIQKAIAGGASTGDAVAKAEKDAGADLPDIRQFEFRRLDLAQFQGNVPPPIQMMFNLVKGQSRVTAGNDGEGVYVVHTTGIEKGDATSNPGLVSQTSQEFRGAFGSELTEQFLRAIRKDVGVKRNEKTISATRARIVGSGQ